MATHSSILARRIPWTEQPGGLHPWGQQESDTSEGLTHTHTHTHTHTLSYSKGGGGDEEKNQKCIIS